MLSVELFLFCPSNRIEEISRAGKLPRQKRTKKWTCLTEIVIKFPIFLSSFFIRDSFFSEFAIFLIRSVSRWIRSVCKWSHLGLDLLHLMKKQSNCIRTEQKETAIGVKGTKYH